MDARIPSPRLPITKSHGIRGYGGSNLHILVDMWNNGYKNKPLSIAVKTGVDANRILKIIRDNPSLFPGHREADH